MSKLNKKDSKSLSHKALDVVFMAAVGGLIFLMCVDYGSLMA